MTVGMAEPVSIIVSSIPPHINISYLKVVMDYGDLVNDEAHLTEAIRDAFGPNALGVCLIKNVPGFVDKRLRLLKLASVFAGLPEDVKEQAVHQESSYLFGWSHGKETMNGKTDVSKGSYYNSVSIRVSIVQWRTQSVS
jgi:hypothetical protein